MKRMLLPIPTSYVSHTCRPNSKKLPNIKKNHQGRRWPREGIAQGLVRERWTLDILRKVWQILHNSSYCSPHQQSPQSAKCLCFFPSPGGQEGNHCRTSGGEVHQFVLRCLCFLQICTTKPFKSLHFSVSIDFCFSLLSSFLVDVQ